MHATLDDSERIAHVLRSIDIRLTRERAGQTTALCLTVSATSIVGASAGDTEAWLVEGGQITRLTARQSRKPLLGDAATVTPFRLEAALGGTLIVASDGLFGYVREDQIVQACSLGWVEQVADALVTAARLPSGKLQDDLAMFVVRPR
jgi:serine/threonine protein phosphatase PrpC